MNAPAFERSVLDASVAPRITECVLGTVVAVLNPPAPGLVQVRLFHYDGPDQQDAPIWARVAVAVAGHNRGCFALPDIDDEVLVTFVGGDSRFPVVIGSLWNGRDAPTETPGSRGIDRWSFRSKDGTKVSIVEERQGQAVLRMEVPGGVSAELRQAGGGELELRAAGSTVKLATDGVTITASGNTTVRASQISVQAGSVSVNTAMATFSGAIQAQTVIANTVVGTVYTPGAGGMW